jgi:hypothetical protein
MVVRQVNVRVAAAAETPHGHSKCAALDLAQFS